MKLFKTREALSRRSMRLWMLRFRKIGIVLAVVGVTTATAVYAHKNGAVARLSEWSHAKMLSVTAGAGFRVTNILISGRDRTPDAELLTRLGVAQGMPVFGIDIAEKQQALSEISWVKDVSVTRRLPDTIVVEMTERQPAALWQYQKKISVIDITGRVLTSDNLQKYAQLPLVVGDDAPLQIKGFLELMHAEPEIAAEVASAVRIGARRWDLHLKNGIVVKLPETDTELALRKLAVQKARHGILDKNILSIDLRIPEQMVVQAAETAPQKKTI
jgi:cell division protein FtsQ